MQSEWRHFTGEHQMDAGFVSASHVLFMSLEVFRMDTELWKGGLEVGWALWAGPAPRVHSLVFWNSFVGRDYPNPHHQWSIPIIHRHLKASQTWFISNHNLF